ncbi:hypothetical protein B0T09DRAFT_331525 [Sordaria sp. MPI-SDFR-AT-0083]|nr:hypothetical protein B0T09DRAFT_331525 [Sordaria sp. MPI-SDFR-AT-0083]
MCFLCRACLPGLSLSFYFHLFAFLFQHTSPRRITDETERICFRPIKHLIISVLPATSEQRAERTLHSTQVSSTTC